nr:teichoic acids export ABC transporter ATP-binding subunit TagH [Lentibacillus sediminis]
MDKAIIASNVTKKYKLYNGTKERLLDLLTPKSYGEDFFALTDVSFEADKGDIIGFIGINGSGKSTLSNIVAGIVPETSGSVEVNGQTSLIAVSAGLKGDLSGRDNIELKLLMLGFDKDQIKALEPEIIEFAELEKFIDQPVKSYSSGMKSRLGFAISVNVNPDVLIIDEALSVGDKAFAEKSLNKMREFKQKGKTMIFVSHSLGQMKQFCEKILWLEYGMVKEYGPVEEVIPKYEDFLQQWKKLSKKEREAYRNFELDLNPKNEEDSFGQRLIDNSHPFEAGESYTEQLTSRLGHIKAGSSYIYSTPATTTEKEKSDGYKNCVYYIKKQATFNNELFYLLSNEPSAKNGLIGWMKASEVSSHSAVAIDDDTKIFYINGAGVAYSRPWGGKKNLLYSSLGKYEKVEFVVSKTMKVGGNLWYYGALDDKQVWIHNNHLVE